MLVFTLIMLVVVTLLSLSSMNSARVGQLLSGNYQWASLAFNNAEAGVIDGEAEIATNYAGVPLFDWSANQNDGLYNAGELSSPVGIWGSNGGHETSADGNEYALEYLGAYTTWGASITFGNPTNRRFLYRVTGGGQSARGSSRVIQTIYATTD